ncbi:MerR family transcriptional regulator [Kribbella sp. NPDC051770]|uniref:MerR family transcriptional regulator n=1 Tax=Kribbella sp. NPDC051770 TaxID=3155413 RepID=UPI00341FA37E
MTPRTWKIGELATATGLSVRALHHYDEIALLRPTSRGPTGHRLYADADVRRLHRILALRGFGLTLTEIGQIVDGDVPDPRGLIRRQLDQVEAQLAAGAELHDRLQSVLAALDEANEPTTESLLTLIEGMNAMNRTLTQQELDTMTAQREQYRDSLGPDELAALEAARRRAVESMTERELEEMRSRRAALMPR